MQDQAFVQIGKIALQEMGNKEPYELFIQNMFPDKDNYKIIVPVFEIMVQKGEYYCIYRNIDIQIVNKKNYSKYGYRKGSSRGGDITFTTKFGDIEKKLKTLLANQFKSLLSGFKDEETAELNTFTSIYKFLSEKENFTKLKNELSDLYNNLSKEDKMASGLSLLFVIAEEEKYLADFKVIQQILLADGTEGKAEKHEVKSIGFNQTCSICLQRKDTLYGFASPFKYATVDKPGMVSGFFNQVNNWKNYPICTNCSLEFELGRTYVANNLNSSFYGRPYYIIPKALLSKDLKSLKQAINRLKELYNDLSKTNTIARKEDLLEKHMAEEKDYYNVNLLFFKEDHKNKSIKIKLLLEEILPSRFKKLFVDAPSVINEIELYKGALSKKENKNLLFNFGILETFFRNDFYDLIYKVFTLQQFSTETLFTKFMDVIRSNYNKMQASDSGYVEMTRLTILKAHLTLAYFRELNLIEHKSNNLIMDTTESLEKKPAFDLNKLKSFVNENAGFLDTPYKIGIFSVGILVRLLLNIQQANLGNTPFEKKLKGYNLNAELLKNVYLEALSKISQYQNFFAYINLREFIDEYFLRNIEKVNRISNNELSFFFVAGIEFGNQFKNKDVPETEPAIQN